MKHVNVRINNIKINNIKNVENGEIFLNTKSDNTLGASIVGIYGQNGTGKTAMIWAFELLKNSFCGVQLPPDTFYYIYQNKDSGKIEVEFEIMIKDRLYNVFYIIELKPFSNHEFAIKRESLEFSAKNIGDKPAIKRTKIIEIIVKNKENINLLLYGPDVRINELYLKDKEVKQKLIIFQALSKEKNVSYIFNDNVRELLNKCYHNLYSDIIEILCFYGRMNLFVLNRKYDALYNINLLPLSARLTSVHSITKSDALPVGLNQTNIEENNYKIVKKVINQINVLLKNIIPGMEVEIEILSEQLNKNAQKEYSCELISKRGLLRTPLKYESEGIKKILCILSSLIAMYNDESIFVAIDELDSGIFEYLLGEILDIINTTGKGQLLFTSHNMRPLEVLDSNSIFITTTNPNKKYIKFTGIKPNNNLRTTLLRTIDLGGQKEEIYQQTSKYQISKAFRKAGETIND